MSNQGSQKEEEEKSRNTPVDGKRKNSNDVNS